MNENSNMELDGDTDRFVREVMTRLTKYEAEGAAASDGSGLFRSEPHIHLDRYSIKNLLYSHDWVYIVCNLVATKISNQRLHVVKVKVEDGKTLSRPAEDHELQALLDRPNPQVSAAAFTYVWSIDLTLGGNGLVYHAKSNDELWNVPFERVDPQFDDQGQLIGYTSTDVENCNTDIQLFKATEILHAMRPDPSYCYWGLSPFIPGKSALLFNQYSSEFLNSFYLKGASPQLQFELQQDVNEKQALRMLRSFEKAYTSRANQRRPLITPAGVKAKPITTSLADQQLIVYIQQNRETIINLLNIPKHELSIQDGGSLGSQEMRLSLRNFWLTTLKPTMRFMEGELNEHFKERLGDDHRIEFDLSSVEALQDDMLKQAELADRLIKSGAFSPNEVRKNIFREPPRPDGDALQNVQSRGEQEQPPPATPQDEQGSDGEPTRSLLTGTRKLEIFGMTKARVEDESMAIAKVIGNSLSLFLKFLDASLRVVNRNAGGFPVLKASDDERIEALLARVKRELNQEFAKNEDDFISGNAEDLTEVADIGRERVISASFDGPDLDAVIAIADGNEPGRLNTQLRTRGIDSFSNISQSASNTVLGHIETGIRKSQTVTEITRRIADSFTDEQMSGARAEKIARTEVGVATMVGREAAFKDAKKALGAVHKTWITTIDSVTRDGSTRRGEDHVKLHLTRANPKTGKFDNGLRFPLDPFGRPEEIINCRCDMILDND